LTLDLNGPHDRVFIVDERAGVEVALVVDCLEVAVDVGSSQAVEVVEVVVGGGDGVLDAGLKGYVDGDQFGILPYYFHVGDVLWVVGDGDVPLDDDEVDGRG
jgi:hypothetical protein